MMGGFCFSLDCFSLSQVYYINRLNNATQWDKVKKKEKKERERKRAKKAKETDTWCVFICFCLFSSLCVRVFFSSARCLWRCRESSGQEKQNTNKKINVISVYFSLFVSISLSLSLSFFLTCLHDLFRALCHKKK